MKYLAAAGGCAACGVSETRASGTWFSVHLCVTERVDMAGWRFAPGRHLRVQGNHSPAEGFGGEKPPIWAALMSSPAAKPFCVRRCNES